MATRAGPRTQTFAVGPSASAKHAGVVADADTHTLPTIMPAGPAQAPQVAMFNDSNGT